MNYLTNFWCLRHVEKNNERLKQPRIIDSLEPGESGGTLAKMPPLHLLTICHTHVINAALPSVH